MPTVVDLSDVKKALGLDEDIITGDYELQTKIAGAEAEYAQFVRPLPGPLVRTGTLPLILPTGVVAGSVTAVDAEGSPLTVVHDPSTGVVTSSGYVAGTVTVSGTAGPVPANHLSAIIEDVAEYWDRTQRTGGSAGRPGYDPGGFDGGGRGPRPVTMYPRIRALAGPVVA